MQTVAIIGLGLIGGSFALSLREAGFRGRILGVSEGQYVDAALQMGVITRGASLQEACQQADLIYLSQTVGGILETIEQIGPLVSSHCLITDVGSTKRTIVDAARRSIQRAHFLGGHPMAGKEKRGIREAETGLFRGRPYVLISDTPSVHPRAAEIETEFCEWLEKMGSIIVRMSAVRHDEVVAYASHLPQLLSTNLANTLAAENGGSLPEIFGQGLLDMTRLAVSSPDLWASILATNRDKIFEAIESFEIQLSALKQVVVNENIQSEFDKAAEFADALRKRVYKN